MKKVIKAMLFLILLVNEMPLIAQNYFDLVEKAEEQAQKGNLEEAKALSQTA